LSRALFGTLLKTQVQNYTVSKEFSKKLAKLLKYSEWLINFFNRKQSFGERLRKAGKFRGKTKTVRDPGMDKKTELSSECKNKIYAL